MKFVQHSYLTLGLNFFLDGQFKDFGGPQMVRGPKGVKWPEFVSVSVRHHQPLSHFYYIINRGETFRKKHRILLKQVYFFLQRYYFVYSIKFIWN